MDEIGNRIRQLIVDNKLKISMTEMAQVTGVSPSQIRYWDRKGYIHSEQDQQNKNHYFTLVTMLQVCTIKYFLDQGYPLRVAVKKEHHRRANGQYFRQFLVDRVLGIDEIGPATGEILLGPLTDDPSQEVYAVVKNGKTSLHLRPIRKDN